MNTSLMTENAFSKDEFTQLCDNIAKNAHIGCGLSDIVYTERLSSGIQFYLDKVPQKHFEEALTIARHHGYQTEEELVWEPAEGECSLTGIDTNCCPCGRHE
jgi:hypothetical protein